jgi:hypothetical protein
LALNPLGEYKPPANVDTGELFPQQFTIGTTPVKVRFPAHEHIIFQNQGLVTIQISKDAARWFDWLTSGLILVLDWHKEDFLWMQTTAGTCVVVITTW